LAEVVCYKDFMVTCRHLRFPALLTAILFLNACGGRSVNQKSAHDLIVALPDGLLDRSDVTIESVASTGPNDAVIETRVRTAFKLERKNGKWEVREIRVGNHQWEKVDNLVKALEAAKSEETRQLMSNLMQSIAKYREAKGTLPQTGDFVALTDVLAPEYLNPLIRLDAWRNPFTAFRPGESMVKLVSAGPDGRPGTADDIELTREFR
jgi:hypothetical protein